MTIATFAHSVALKYLPCLGVCFSTKNSAKVGKPSSTPKRAREARHWLTLTEVPLTKSFKPKMMAAALISLNIFSRFSTKNKRPRPNTTKIKPVKYIKFER